MAPVSSGIIVQPDDGVQPVRDFIGAARRTLLVKQFSLTEPSLVAAVIDRHRSGVAVRVMLNPQRSGGDRANDETFEQLSAAGVTIQWTNPSFYVTHEKSIVIEDEAAMVATFNLCDLPGSVNTNNSRAQYYFDWTPSVRESPSLDEFSVTG